MPLGLLGLKIGMTQITDDKGTMIPVTVLQAGPCPVLQVKTAEGPDKYNAIQLGFLDKPRNKALRPERGHVAKDFSSNRRKALTAAGQAIPPKADCEPQRHIREFRLEKATEHEVGKVLTADEVFKDITHVDVIGTSKGRGFTGAMKRWGFQGLPAAHGAKKVHRSAGSIGSHASNRGSGRPKLGHKAAGQHGNGNKTVRNLKIVKIDAENNLILVRGAVCGPNGGFVMIRPTGKK